MKAFALVTALLGATLFGEAAVKIEGMVWVQSERDAMDSKARLNSPVKEKENFVNRECLTLYS